MDTVQGDVAGERVQVRSLAPNKQVGLLSRLYVWSICLEPLNFFVIFDRLTIGFTGNLARLLQVCVLMLIVGNALSRQRFAFRLHWPLDRPYISAWFWFLAFIAWALVALVHGVLAGRMTIPEHMSSVSLQYMRPVMEYLVAIYVVLYFVVLPRFMLMTPAAVNYFFRVFMALFVGCIAIGWLDLLYSSLTNQALVSRHIYEHFTTGARYIGVRFHGLAGEPRDAVGYLLLGLGVAVLYAKIQNRPINRLFLLVVVLSLVATQSATGFVTAGIFCGLYLVFLSPGMNLRYLFLAVGGAILIVSLLIVSFWYSPRLQLYASALPGVWELLASSGELPAVLAVQSNNIYPIWSLISQALQFNVLPLLMGSGLGSASILNNQFGWEGLSNPHANVVRTLYETGLIGSLIYVFAFLQPVRRAARFWGSRHTRTMLLIMILGVSAVLGQRSSMPFLLLGVLLATHRLALVLRIQLAHSNPPMRSAGQ